MIATKWRYHEPDPDGGEIVVEMTEPEIIATYWPWWSKAMEQAGKYDQITHQHCIDDFVVVHWAERVG